MQVLLTGKQKNKKMIDDKLPLEEISAQHFFEFRKKFLDLEILGNEALIQIKSQFDLDPITTKTVRTNCDEMHAHSYSCLDFDNRISAVVLRLIDEIEMYRERLDEIRKKADYSSY